MSYFQLMNPGAFHFQVNLRGYLGSLPPHKTIHVDVGPGCVACGSEHHMKKVCPYKFFTCGYCAKIGHVIWVCYKLNGLCYQCKCRGHSRDQCESRTNEEWKKIYLHLYKLGKYSSRCQGNMYHPYGFYGPL